MKYLLIVALATLVACNVDILEENNTTEETSNNSSSIASSSASSSSVSSSLSSKELCEKRRPIINPDCSSLKFNDGRGGLLAKQSDNRPQLAIILPGSWQGLANIKAFKTDGSLEDLSFAGCANPEANGALRQHFRGRVNEPCTNYTGVFAVNDIAKSCELIMPKGACERND